MEITNVSTVLVPTGENVPFTETPVPGGACIRHREGSGIVMLRGLTSGQCRARYLVVYSGNIAVPEGGTVGAISLSLAIEGEPLASTRMVVTPAAAEEFFNVNAHAYIDVPKGCCMSVAVENTAGQPLEVANSNLVVTREA